MGLLETILLVYILSIPSCYALLRLLYNLDPRGFDRLEPYNPIFVMRFVSVFPVVNTIVAFYSLVECIVELRYALVQWLVIKRVMKKLRKLGEKLAKENREAGKVINGAIERFSKN